MISYKNKSMDAFVYIGNYWTKRPEKVHKDIRDASTVRLPLVDLIQ